MVANWFEPTVYYGFVIRPAEGDLESFIECWKAILNVCPENVVFLVQTSTHDRLDDSTEAILELSLFLVGREVSVADELVHSGYGTWDDIKEKLKSAGLGVSPLQFVAGRDAGAEYLLTD